MSSSASQGMIFVDNPGISSNSVAPPTDPPPTLGLDSNHHAQLSIAHHSIAQVCIAQLSIAQFTIGQLSIAHPS